MAEKETERAAQGTTRRDFLKGAVIGGAGLTLAGMLGGCAGAGSEISGRGADGQYPYSVHSTDVLIVGAGLAGMTAARAATTSGAKVMVIEKAKYGHCGNTGIAQGTFTISSEYSADKSGVAATSAFALDLVGVADQDFIMSNVQNSIKKPILKFCEQSGCVMERTRKGGFPWGMHFYPDVTAAPFLMVCGGFWKFSAQALERLGTEIFDRMMMVDIAKGDDGSIAGVVAIDLQTGEVHLFRAKKVIMATGSFHWAHGTTIGGPDSTGETQALLLKNGLPMRDVELNLVDLEAPGPYGQMLDGPDQGWMEVSSGPTIGGPYYSLSLNKDGEVFMKGYMERPGLTFVENFVGSVLCSVREILQGKGNEDGSLYRDVTSEITGEHPLSVYGMVAEWGQVIKEAFGEDALDFSRVKTYIQSYGSGAQPQLNASTLETDIPGLYYAGATNGSFASLFVWGSGNISGAAAAAAAAEAPLLDYDAEAVQATIAKNFSWLEKDFAKDSIRPITIHRKIQKAYAQNLLCIKSEKGITKALKELLRIQSEDLPKMATADKSKIMNGDWRNAMEAEGMLTMSIAAATASLERKDTRPMHFRVDYPVSDNVNYLVHLWTSLNKDGTCSIKKGDINDTHISKKDILAQLPELDISIPNPPAS